MHFDKQISDFLQKQSARAFCVATFERCFVSLACAAGVASAILLSVAIFSQAGFANPLIWFAIALLPAGIIAGLIWSFIAGGERKKIASRLDEKLSLKQIFATADELVNRNDDSQPARLIKKQACDAIADLKSQVAYSKLSRQKVYASALMIFIFAVSISLASWKSKKIAPVAQLQNATQFDQLTDSQKQNLIKKLLEKADKKKGTTEAKRMREIARIVKLDSKEQFAKLMKRLKAEGFELQKILPDEFKFLAGVGADRELANKTNARDKEADKPVPKPGDVAVYNPDYAKHASDKKLQSNQRSIVEYSNWQLLIRQANQKMKIGNFPHKYQSAIRKYFEDNKQKQVDGTTN